MPEERADNFLRLIRRAGRGRLKVYLGYGAGVGKTYQMLLEGHRLKDEGIDVVVGLVETHGRPETARLIEGLEVVPRRRQEYRGVVLEEMDLDAVLARKPQVALIDELAHTNVPDSRNPKRYQDVQDILAAGIHVITTLNIQHLESLYDTVEKATRVKIRERIPDTVLGEADQLVNVDLTTEDLRKRLLEGKVYPPERIQTALENFFKAANLEKLRELTLRELAAQIDQRRRETPEEEAAGTPDQIMVCLSSRGPNSEMLLRYASRLAGKLNRNWYAVYVQTPSEEPTVIDSHTQRILSGTLTLAKQLGAMVFTYKGEDIPDTLLRFAREYRVGTIVVGCPSPIPAWKRLFGADSTVDRLIRDAGGMTVVVLDTRKGEALHPRPSRGTPDTISPPERADGALRASGNDATGAEFPAEPGAHRDMEPAGAERTRAAHAGGRGGVGQRDRRSGDGSRAGPEAGRGGIDVLQRGGGVPSCARRQSGCACRRDGRHPPGSAGCVHGKTGGLYLPGPYARPVPRHAGPDPGPSRAGLPEPAPPPRRSSPAARRKRSCPPFRTGRRSRPPVSYDLVCVLITGGRSYPVGIILEKRNTMDGKRVKACKTPDV